MMYVINYLCVCWFWGFCLLFFKVKIPSVTKFKRKKYVTEISIEVRGTSTMLVLIMKIRFLQIQGNTMKCNA